MSILMGPFDKRSTSCSSHREEERVKDMMVFGYQCKLYRDDVKAELENSGSMLIPWMGDSTLMVDRYDIRNHFDDKAQFGIKPSLPHRPTDEEEALEVQLDEERYLALGQEILEEDLDSEESVSKASYSAISYTYSDRESDESSLVPAGPEVIEHPPTSSVDVVEDERDMYYDPPGLDIPFYVERPYSKKFQSIIEHTAKFVSTQGQQMEIIIKTKQKYNARFSFLHHDDRLFPYYKQLLHAISSGSYTPSPPPPPPTSSSQTNSEMEKSGKNGVLKTEEEKVVKTEEVKERKTKRKRHFVDSSNEKKTEEEEEDEDIVDLHPLLRSTILPKRNTTPTATPTTLLTSLSMGSINSAPTVTMETTPEEATNKEEKGIKTEDSETSKVNDDTNTTTYPGYDVMAAYYEASQQYTVGPPPPPPDLQPIVDRTAEYVAKNGGDFQRTVILKHVDDRRFDFMHPWNQFYEYYKKRVERSLEEIEKLKPLNLQRLSAQGRVNFKVSSKPISTLQLPIGVVDLHYDEQQEDVSDSAQDEERRLLKKQKLSLDASGQIDGEFKKFLSTVKAML